MVQTRDKRHHGQHGDALGISVSAVRLTMNGTQLVALDVPGAPTLDVTPATARALASALTACAQRAERVAGGAA